MELIYQQVNYISKLQNCIVNYTHLRSVLTPIYYHISDRGILFEDLSDVADMIVFMD